MTNNKKSESNPFEFAKTTVAESSKIGYTPALIAHSNGRAAELMRSVSEKPELHTLANRAIDVGEPQDLIDLIKAVFDDETVHADSELLTGASEDELSRLLESRRSDRSKAKAKGPRTNARVCQTYISAMYAEMLIREYWQKPYSGVSVVVDSTDTEAVTRRIKSLQSKKSRLNKLAAYDADAKAELEETVAEIERLNALRPTTRTSSVTAVKSLEVDQLRAMLKDIDPATLPEAEQAKFISLMAKLG